MQGCSRYAILYARWVFGCGMFGKLGGGIGRKPVWDNCGTTLFQKEKVWFPIYYDAAFVQNHGTLFATDVSKNRTGAQVI